MNGERKFILWAFLLVGALSGFGHNVGFAVLLDSGAHAENPDQPASAAEFGPEVMRHPVRLEIYAGRTARLTAAVDGFPPITSVQWQKDGVEVVDDERVSGAATTNLVITGVEASDVGAYTMVATSSRGTATSNPANLAITTHETMAYPSALAMAEPLANWRLNEPETLTDVFEPNGGFTGEYQEGALHGSIVEGPRPPVHPGFGEDNTAVQLGGADVPGWAVVPTPTLSAEQATIIAWIYPVAAQTNYAGIFMTGDGTHAGLGYTTNNQLGYTWNDDNAGTWGFNSRLRPPVNEWSMAVLVVNSNRATIYLGSGGTISAAVNPIPHITETWGGPARIGDDPGGTGRTFNGRIDDVSFFNRALSFDEVAALYAAGTGSEQYPPPIIAQQPADTTGYAGADAQFRAAVTGAGRVTFQWMKGATIVADDARISGATTDMLTINISPPLTPGITYWLPRILTVRRRVRPPRSR